MRTCMPGEAAGAQGWLARHECRLNLTERQDLTYDLWNDSVVRYEPWLWRHHN